MDALLPHDDDCFFDNLILTPVSPVEVVAFPLARQVDPSLLDSRFLHSVVHTRRHGLNGSTAKSRMMCVQDSSFIAITRRIILRILLRQCRDLALIQSGTEFLILPNGKSRMM